MPPAGEPKTGATTSREEPSAAERVRQMFAAIAPRYDFLNHFLSLRRDIAWREATAEALQEVLGRPASIAVDVCCGTGDLTLALARFSAGRVIGADFCRPMVHLARRKAGNHHGAVHFLEADTLALPLRGSSVDAIAVAFGLRNLANAEGGLQEMRRLLKPGGVLAILEFSRVTWPVFGPLFRLYFRHVLPRLGTWISGVHGPYQYLPDSVARFPDQESLAELMRRAGLVNVRYRNFTGGVAALHLGEEPGGCQ